VIRGWRLWALLVTLMLGGCQALVTPLGHDVAAVEPTAGDDGDLVNLVACWEAEPLAELLRMAYEAQYPSSAVLVNLTNSQHAMELLQRGEASLGLIVTMADQEPQVPTGWITRELAVDAVALMTSPDLAVASISSDDLSRLYAGQVVDWADLGFGEGQPAFVTRERGTVLRLLFEERIMGDRSISTAAAVVPHNHAMLELVSTTPKALGYVPATLVDDRVRVVALDGKLPTHSEIERGSYPLRSSLWLVMPVSSEGLADGGALRLASFALGARMQREISARYVRP